MPWQAQHFQTLWREINTVTPKVRTGTAFPNTSQQPTTMNFRRRRWKLPAPLSKTFFRWVPRLSIWSYCRHLIVNPPYPPPSQIYPLFAPFPGQNLQIIECHLRRGRSSYIVWMSYEEKRNTVAECRTTKHFVIFFRTINQILRIDILTIADTFEKIISRSTLQSWNYIKILDIQIPVLVQVRWRKWKGASAKTWNSVRCGSMQSVVVGSWPHRVTVSPSAATAPDEFGAKTLSFFLASGQLWILSHVTSENRVEMNTSNTSNTSPLHWHLRWSSG